MSCSTVRKEFVLATRMPLETGLILFFKVAFVNGVLFIISIGIFLWIMIDNALRAHPPPLPQKMPHHPPTPGNIPGPPPSLNRGCINVKSGGNRWAHWLPGVSQTTGYDTWSKHDLRCFRSNVLRVCAIRDGGVQSCSLLFRKNQAKWAAVAYRHFVT